MGATSRGPASRSVSRAIGELAFGRRKPSAVRPDVFVSYPRAGSVLREWVYRFVEALGKASGAQIGMPSFFLDVEDRLDAEFDGLRPILDRSRVLLAFLTPHYLASSWCLAEWQTFEDRERAEGRTLIVPVALRGASTPPGRFSERVVIDGSSVDLADTNDAAMAALVKQTAKELIATLEGRPLPEWAPDPGRETGPALRSVEPATSRPRILFVAANPLGTQQLALDVEAREIMDVLSRSQAREHLEIHTRWVTSPGNLRRALRQLSPVAVHFSGQGASDGLYLEGSDGLPQLVSGKALAMLMRAGGSDLRLVVLNACYSDAQAAALSEVVDCVVGVVASISDRAAIAFSAGFYQALAVGESVAAACEMGRAMVSVHGDGDPEAMIQLRPRQGVTPDTVFLTTQPQPRPPKAPSGKRRAGAR